MRKRKIIDYKTLANYGVKSISGEHGYIDLDEQVKEYLIAGWYLHGHTFSSEDTVYQAMVKYED